MKQVLATLICLAAATANASDWQMAGGGSVNEDEFLQFFDADTVEQITPSLIRVWTKAVTIKELNKVLAPTKNSKLVIDATASKVLEGYAPRYYQLETVVKGFAKVEQLRDTRINVTSFEIVMNKLHPKVIVSALWEIDCARKQYKVLDRTIFQSTGNARRSFSSTEAKSEYIEPDTNSQYLSWLVCKK
jgi:hypothetical protein